MGKRVDHSRRRLPHPRLGARIAAASRTKANEEHTRKRDNKSEVDEFKQDDQDKDEGKAVRFSLLHPDYPAFILIILFRVPSYKPSGYTWTRDEEDAIPVPLRSDKYREPALSDPGRLTGYMDETGFK